jgi:hypothetical protein
MLQCAKRIEALCQKTYDRKSSTGTSTKVQLNTHWSKEWWTLLEGDLNVDWTRGAKTGAVLEGEVGRRLAPHWRVSVY